MLTYQELYERAAEVERVKTELRTLNPINHKRKGFQRGTLSESVNQNHQNQKKPTPVPSKSRPVGSTASCAKCGRTNHTTPECRVGTNKCMWCGSHEHLIAACPWRMKAVDKGVAKPLAPPHQGAPPPRPVVVGQAYVISKKEAATSGMVVTGTLFLNSKPFCVLFDSGATHSFISTRSAMQLNLEDKRTETNYRIKLPNDCVIEYPNLL